MKTENSSIQLVENILSVLNERDKYLSIIEELEQKNHNRDVLIEKWIEGFYDLLQEDHLLIDDKVKKMILFFIHILSKLKTENDV